MTLMPGQNAFQARTITGVPDIASADAQVSASDRALFGVKIEATAGQRTILDVLTAKRSLIDAGVNCQIAQHERIIAGNKLLAVIGRLSFAALTPADTRAADGGRNIARRIDLKSLVTDLGSLDSLPLRPGLWREPPTTGQAWLSPFAASVLDSCPGGL